MATKIKFENPETQNLGIHIQNSASLGVPLVEKNCHEEDKGAIICGLGHSITDRKVLNKVRSFASRGWVVFGLKEAISYLSERDIKVSYSVNMDPQALEIGRTPIVEGVTYCVASSCHPDFVGYLVDSGQSVRLFHSACGYQETSMAPGIVLELEDRISDLVEGIQKISQVKDGVDLEEVRGFASQILERSTRPSDCAIITENVELQTQHGLPFTPVCVARRDETAVYADLFDTEEVFVACGGFTCANRALALAKYMGFDRIALAGCDFGWRENETYYADFCQAAPADEVRMHDSGLVDGKTWWTRPDLLASAVDVAQQAKRGKIQIWGDSLAAAIAKRDDEFIESICSYK